MTRRLLIVSNRLPVTVTADARAPQGAIVKPSPGGLATGLKGLGSNRLWIGWPGDVSNLSESQLKEIEHDLAALKTHPVYLTAEEVERYYEGFSNGVLWPLFHYLLGRVPITAADWAAYKSANARFADVVVEQYQPGDLIWIHDYQLVLVPELVRRKIPDAKIGFFLHIPFPATDVFRILPWRDEVLAGMLGADLVGFHTFNYVRHFAKSIVRTLGASFSVDRAEWEGRTVRLGVFPMGIDVDVFERLATMPDVLEQVQTIRGAGTEQILLGIDRLDYTKGIHKRLLAFERLLEQEPQLRGKVRFIQLAVPSREKVAAYAKFRRQVDETVGRINGAYGTTTQMPVHYLYRAMTERQVVALYRAADVMLVTPLRDGMNLVAKEYVASRVDGDGVLVLSEFAGASFELGEALNVNPYDIEGMAAAFHRALTMPEDERRTRMGALRDRVKQHDVHRWAHSFIDTMEKLEVAQAVNDEAYAPPEIIGNLVRHARAARDLVLLLDYDGALTPIAPAPELAAPTRKLLDLLVALSNRSSTAVYVVSGRPRVSLDRWLGHLPIGLYAEHGGWRRLPDVRAGEWTRTREVVTTWKDAVRHILDEFTDRTPGSHVEEKSVGYAWHYRLADPELGSLQARELALHLTDILSNAPAEVLHGHKVVEVRQQGIHKGLVVGDVLSTAPAGAFVIAVGDDRTDEDMFAALPKNPDHAASVHVGHGPTRARWRVPDPGAVHDMLRAILVV